ncbi:hypothetical protein ApDm4_0317 [Acetobacter pomorum]|nr:hypothetical protein ApDm4_0317 [Acetobacter pomorum]
MLHVASFFMPYSVRKAVARVQQPTESCTHTAHSYCNVILLHNTCCALRHTQPRQHTA